MTSFWRLAAVVVSGFGLLAAVEGAEEGVGEPAVRVYWRNGGAIQRAHVDGTRVENVVAGRHAGRCEIAGCGLAVDSAGGKLYWSGVARGRGGAIRRANLDGSRIEDLVTTAADGWRGLLHAGDLAVDVDDGKLYWVDWGHGEVRRADLDGSGIETVVGNRDWMDAVHGDGLALDAGGGGLYFSSRSGSLRRARLDGSVVDDWSSGVYFGRPRDVAGGKVYLTYAGVHNRGGGIRRADVFRREVDELVTARLQRPAGLAVDAAGEKMYWTDRLTGKVQRANLDGSRVEDLVTGLRFPDAIALESRVPRRPPHGRSGTR